MTRYKIEKAILAAILLGLVQIAGGQREPGSTNPKTSEAQAVNQESSGLQESVGIHGHWTVTVRNADGTVATRREFENSITDMGKSFVLNLLAGGTSTNETRTWQLDIGGSLCFQKPSTTLSDCQISVQPTRPIPPGTTNFASLPLEMSGTVKMDGSGQIISVATQITYPAAKTSPARKPDPPVTFSSRDLTKPDSATGQTPAPINVQAGQNLDFTVDISIS